MTKLKLAGTKFETVDYTIPAWLLSLMVNGDASGLSDDEEELGNNFLAQVAAEFGPGHWSVADEKHSDFSYNEVDAFLGETWVATYHYQYCVPAS